MEQGDKTAMVIREQMKGQLARACMEGWDGLREIFEDRDRRKEIMGGCVEVLNS